MAKIEGAYLESWCLCSWNKQLTIFAGAAFSAHGLGSHLKAKAKEIGSGLIQLITRLALPLSSGFSRLAQARRSGTGPLEGNLIVHSTDCM